MSEVAGGRRYSSFPTLSRAIAALHSAAGYASVQAATDGGSYQTIRIQKSLLEQSERVRFSYGKTCAMARRHEFSGRDREVFDREIVIGGGASFVHH
ncbi:MAG: hypothetical protein OXC26_25835, partial [Albidovulum sp.]|nr:hypothetical protein [Albidovulum sp.]